MQAFECRGMWWILSDAERRTPGTLYVSSSGELRLSLLGCLGPTNGLDVSKEYDVVLGSVDGPLGDEVTLVHCTVTSAKYCSYAEAQEEYRAQRGFFGAHLTSSFNSTLPVLNSSPFAFRRLHLRLKGLGAWAHSLSGLRQGGWERVHAGKEATLLSYLPPDPVEGPIPGAEISLGFALAGSLGARSHTFCEQPGLTVSCDPPLSDEEINQRFVSPLQNLMTFVAGRPQEVEEVSLWRENIFAPTVVNPKIRLIGPRVFPEKKDEKTESVYPHELLFTLADLEDGFAPFIERWLRLATVYHEAFSVFFGMYYGPDVYLDFSFLRIIESLRLYYTRTPDGKAHRDREEERRQEILSRLSSKDADWLRFHVWTRPFPPLRVILENLLQESSEIMKPLLLTDEWEFIREVESTLGYAIQRDKEILSRQPMPRSGAELYWMIAKLRILFTICVLRQLGFSVEKSHSLISKNRSYQHLGELVHQQQINSKK